jgi:hypothetical protein
LNQSGRHSGYQVYVLRLWQEPGDASEHSVRWRFVLEEPKTGQRRGFADFAALMDFLEMELQRGETIDNSLRTGMIEVD